MIHKFLIKKGKITKAKKIIFDGLYKSCTKFNKKTNPYTILKSLYKRLRVQIEVRTIKVRRGRYLVPFPISLKRSLYLTMKWFLTAIHKNKQRVSFSEKFTKEISLIFYKPKFSTAYQLKRDNIKKAFANQSNFHYRW